MANDIDIRVVVDGNGAIQVFDKLGAKVQEFGDRAKAQSSMVDNLFIGLAQGIGQKLLPVLTALPGALVDFVGRGSEVADMSEAFGRLSGAAGSMSDVLLGQLKEATAGTISDFELMKRSNEALNAGLKPDNLVTVAKAARALGETFGGDLKSNMDGLLDSLQKGDDRFLKQRGIVVDNARAIKDYASSIGVLPENLNEAGKKAALMEAVLKAANEQIEKAGTLSDDSGDAISRFEAALSNAKDQVSVAIGNNADLNRVLQELSNTVANIDLTSLINNLATLTSGLANAASAAANFVNSGIDKIADSIRSLQKDKFGNFGNFLKEINENLGKGTKESVAQAIAEIKKLSPVIGDNVSLQAAWGAEFQQVQQKAKAAKDALAGVTPVVIEQTKHVKTSSEELKKLRDRHTTVSTTLKSIIDVNKEYASKIQEVINQQREGILTNDEMVKHLGRIEEAYKKAGGSAKTYEIILNNLKIEAGKKQIAANNQEIEDLKKKLEDNSFLGQFKGTGLGQEFYSSVSSGLASAVVSGLENGFNSDTVRSLGATGGAALGTALFGPAGGQVGEVLGRMYADAITKIGKTSKDTARGLGTILLGPIGGAQLGEAVDKMFGGGDSAGTKARKSADKFFADVFDANRLSVVINGELVQIKDLVFSGNSSGGLFDTLPASVQSAFQGVGAAFQDLLGVANDLGVNIGNVLANNVGGSLNNLQLLVEATGKSFEDLKQAVLTSFLDGKLSIDEALTSLRGIEQVSQKGIPDGLGMIDVAFNNIAAAGTKGGRALIDAIQDVGYEARELGIKDFASLAAEIKKRLPESAAAIDTLFESLRTSGIGTIDQLTKATTEQLLGALGKLSASSFPFKEAAQDMDELLDKVSKLDGKSIMANVKLNVTSNYDANTQNLVKSGFVVTGQNQAGGTGEGFAR